MAGRYKIERGYFRQQRWARHLQRRVSSAAGSARGPSTGNPAEVQIDRGPMDVAQDLAAIAIVLLVLAAMTVAIFVPSLWGGTVSYSFLEPLFEWFSS